MALATFNYLPGRFALLAKHLNGGDKTLAEFAHLIQLRASAERRHADALTAIGNAPCGESTELGTMAEAINALKCDALNHARSAHDFAQQLQDEVLQLIADVRKIYQRR